MVKMPAPTLVCPSAPMSPTALVPGTVDVWCVPLTARPALIASLAGLLDATESQRAARFLRPFLRDRYVVAHGVLRMTIGAYSTPSDRPLAFTIGLHGKPAVRDSRLQFNLSHADDLLLLGLSLDTPIGIDIERIRPDLAIESLVAPFLSEPERWRLAQLPESHRPRSSFQAWTRVEARAKAAGTGLSSLPVTSEDASAPPTLDIPIDHEHVATVAADVERVRYWRFASSDAAADFFSPA
jgi:4'-phosphopantetheinyl transferase